MSKSQGEFPSSKGSCCAICSGEECCSTLSESTRAAWNSSYSSPQGSSRSWSFMFSYFRFLGSATNVYL